MADDLKTGDRMARAAMTAEPMAKKIAERYLASRGYEILARDWRCEGERVDIVAKDGDVAVLVDVAAGGGELGLSLIHISEPTRREWLSRMPSSA